MTLRPVDSRRWDHRHLPAPLPTCFFTPHGISEWRPTDCVVLEDAEKGLRAARGAGMLVVAVPTTHTRTNDFSAATLVVDSLCDLSLERLKRLVANAT